MTQQRETAAAPSPIPPQTTVTPVPGGDQLAVAFGSAHKRTEEQKLLGELLDFTLRYAKTKKHTQPLHRQPVNLNAELRTALAMMLYERMDNEHLQMLAGLDSTDIEMVVKESLKFGAY